MTGNTLGEQWQFLLGAGVILAILGVLAIVFPFVTGVAISVLFGALLIVGSILHFAQAFSGRGWSGFIVQILLGVLYAVAGISLMANPVVGLATLTILLVAFFVIDGILEIVMGIRLRGERNWVWPIVSGVISLALAYLIWTGFPSSAVWAVGLLVGVGLLTSGLQMILVAMGGRRAVEEAAVAPAAGAGGA
jgi:uncharacterized membrane protein HdeD (DUF308 family)